MTFTPETINLKNEHYRVYEASNAHGYPATFWLQAGLCYGAAVYTAQEQGVFAKGQLYGKFWSHHYFDWILAAQRAAKYGVVGGFFAGIFLFGDYKLSLRRISNRYDYFLSAPTADPRSNYMLWRTKF